MLVNRSFQDVGPFANNIYVVFDANTREAAVLDVGFEPERVIELVRRERLSVRWLLATHAHYDHVAAMLPLQREVGGAFALHPADRPLLERVELQGSMFGLPAVEVPAVALELFEGERELPQLFPDLPRMARSSDIGPAMRHLSLGIDDDRGADHALDHLPVHVLLSPGSVDFHDFMVWIRKGGACRLSDRSRAPPTGP